MIAAEQNAAIPTPAKARDAMASISFQLGTAGPAGLSTGEHATLRRMFLTGRPAADGLVVKLLHAAGLERHDYNRNYDAWKLVVHAAALLSGTGRSRAHDGRKGLGFALHEAGVSENRLMRLTAARGAALVDQLVLAARIVAQKGAGPLNLWTVLHLAGRDPDRAEEARIRIAQDYYTAAARSKGESK